MTRRVSPPRSSRPWTAEDDRQLCDMLAVGLSIDFWPAVMPDRRVGELLERRLELALPTAPLL